MIGALLVNTPGIFGMLMNSRVHQSPAEIEWTLDTLVTAQVISNLLLVGCSFEDSLHRRVRIPSKARGSRFGIKKSVMAGSPLFRFSQHHLPPPRLFPDSPVCDAFVMQLVAGVAKSNLIPHNCHSSNSGPCKLRELRAVFWTRCHGLRYRCCYEPISFPDHGGSSSFPCRGSSPGP